MVRRFSYAEKGKALDLPTAHQPPRRRIRAPEMDTTDLVRQNSLTLIGRLTNPQEQRMWTMIPYISSWWELRGRAVGSDLGNHCFQFRFDYDEDLQKVLDNRPYQYARWMLILQKWEPIISSTFPSQIPFWIQLKGLPLHYWKKELLCNIGRELGDYKEQILTKMTAKIKVEVNGLQPLAKDAVIEFEGGQEAVVTFEYENLGKHCSLCYSLSHEEDLCPEKLQLTDLQEAPTRQAIRESHYPAKVPSPTIYRPFNQRQDRYGRLFGERPSTKRTLIARVTEPVLRNHNLEPPQPRHQHTPDISPPYNRNRLAPPPTIHRQNGREIFRSDTGLGLSGPSRRGNQRNSPPRQVWREKPPNLNDQSVDISTTRGTALVGRNLDTEAFTPVQRTHSEAEIMSSLQEVTVQYANVDDPVERAARLQRVLEGEARGLMADTARSMFTAQVLQQHITADTHLVPTTVIPLVEVCTDVDIRPVSQPLEPSRRPRGRPPTTKPNQAVNPSEAGPSKRKTKQGRISPFLRISPLSRVVMTRTSPVTHNHGTRRSRVTLQRGPSIPATPTATPPTNTMVPAIRRATRKDKADFHSLQDPLP
ncbi:unnamed protein product [Microthlaspi erraticum]|uniref:DUF4283 domain-containing protein n=1 Tax=Microthlaspi erraticum TaxID=1685480 RepID=A0A6D2KAX4_9BRAS|nr:unnamed protein product [Microthlaspi erraticum]